MMKEYKFEVSVVETDGLFAQNKHTVSAVTVHKKTLPWTVVAWEFTKFMNRYYGIDVDVVLSKPAENPPSTVTTTAGWGNTAVDIKMGT